MELQKMTDLKPSFDTILETKTFFSSSGWAKYQQKLLDNLKVLNYNIQQLTSGMLPLSDERIESLKQNIAERKILRLLLLMKVDMLDEVDPNWEEQINCDKFGLEKDIENSPSMRGA